MYYLKSKDTYINLGFVIMIYPEKMLKDLENDPMYIIEFADESKLKINYEDFLELEQSITTTNGEGEYV